MGGPTPPGSSTPIAAVVESALGAPTTARPTSGTAGPPQSASRTQGPISTGIETAPGTGSAGDNAAASTAAPGVDEPIEQVSRSVIRLENDTDDDGTSTIADELAYAHLNDPPAPLPRCRRSCVFRLGSAFEKFGRWLKDSADNEEDFTRNIRLVYTNPVHDDTKRSREASAEIDTKCPGDYVSLRTARRLLGTDFSMRPPKRVATTLKHGEIYSVGTVTLRWTARNDKRGWVLGMPSFSPRYYTTTFEVIDTTEFDVILGRTCINKHKLLKLDNRIFGMYKAHRPAIATPTNVAETQRQATVRRDNAEQRRQRAEAQSTQANNSANTNTGTNAKT